MPQYKIAIYENPGSSVIVYENKDNAKAAYERGIALATNIFGLYNPKTMFIRAEEIPPTA